MLNNGGLELKLHVNRNEFIAMVKGKKTVEVRAWSSRVHYEKLGFGDTIIFLAHFDEMAAATVKKVTHYRTIRECLEKEGLKNCLPWVASIDSGIAYVSSVIRPSRDGDAKERIAKGGVFGIKIEMNRKRF